MKQQGQWAPAAAAFEQVLQLDPQWAEGHFQLGQLYQALGQFPLAIQHLHTYLAFCPERADVYFALGNVYLILKDDAQAQICYLKAMELASPDAQALSDWLTYLLARVIVSDYEPVKIKALFLSLAQVRPECLGTIACLLGRMMETLHNSAEAAQCYALALQSPTLSDRPAWALKSQLLVPVIAEDLAYQKKYLEQACAALRALEQQNLPAQALIHPDLSNAFVYFLNSLALEGMAYTYYHPYRERQIFGKIIRSWLPDLPQTSRRALRVKGLERRRVGFVLAPSSAVQTALCELLRQLPTAQLEIHLLLTHHIDLAAFFQAPLPTDFCCHFLAEAMPIAYEQVLALDLDILYLSEPNASQPLQAIFSAFRLAPVQVTSWLSSGSTGQPYMDYFLSSHLLEQAENPQRFYSEQLILLPSLPTYFVLPSCTGHLTRADYGLPEQTRWYLCPHAMVKIQPEMDDLFGGILRQDPEGILVLLSNPDNAQQRQILLNRFQKTLPELLPRIHFLPYLKPQAYLNLLALGDVMLDPRYFGGGVTTYQALALGLPIITWPGEHLHGRIASACYLKMGLSECVVHSAEAYIQTAVEMACNAEHNQRTRAQILAKIPLIFEDQQAVEDLARFLCEVAPRS
ncbi:MAG: tetratricopeptide repeat protein [Candidatus Sericytochromatia bacterium]